MKSTRFKTLSAVVKLSMVLGDVATSLHHEFMLGHVDILTPNMERATSTMKTARDKKRRETTSARLEQNLREEQATRKKM